MLAWMRRYNADPSNPRPLSFYGFDMQSPERAARATLAYLDRVDPGLAATARAGLGHLAIPFSDPDAWGYRPIVARDPTPRCRRR
jgi:erythromycin esterase